jgi:hypothetical protein
MMMMMTKQIFETVFDAEEFLRRSGYAHEVGVYWVRASWTAVLEVIRGRVTVDYI